MSNALPLAIEAVLFDLDGTLIDHDAAAAEAVTATFALPAQAPHLDRERIIRRWQELESSAMDRYLTGELTFVEQRRLRITRLADELGLGAWSDQRADAWFSPYLECYQAAWQTYPDVAPTLSTLATEYGRLRLGVLTNGEARQQRQKLEKVCLTSVLPHVTVSSETGVAKPDARIFHAACDELQLPPSHVVYVGDWPRTDAEAANAAGLHGIWLDRHDTTTTTSTPAPRIRTLSELAPLLARRP